MNYYLFTTVDADHISGLNKVAALDIVNARLRSKRWPIYSRTHNKDKIQSGDVCLFYVGGYKKMPRHVIATAIIENIAIKGCVIDHEDILTGIPYKHLALKDVVHFEQPVCIIDKLSSLTFIPKDTRYWGTALQGGCKKITANDFLVLSGL